MATQEFALTISNLSITLALVSLFILMTLEKKRPRFVFSKTVNKQSMFTNFTAFLFNNVVLTLIRATSFTAGEAEIKERIAALRAAGYTQFTIQLVPGQESALADWARIRKAFA